MATLSPYRHPYRNLGLTVLLVLVIFAAIKWAEANLDGYQMRILNLVAINAILAVSLNFIYGFSGMFSLGHAGFMAVGAYVTSICILPESQITQIWYLDPIWAPLNNVQAQLTNLLSPFGVSAPANPLDCPGAVFFVAILVGGLAAALLSFVIALPVMRLGGDYLGIATLGFAEIIRIIFTNLEPITNGAIGLRGIPPVADIWWNFSWLLITLFVILTLLKSNFGNVLKSIRDDEIAARTMGINTTGYRTMAFCVGGFFAGVGGGLLASLVTTIDPKMFNFQLTFNILLIVVAGGLGSITGSLLGAVVITILLEWLRIVESPFNISSFLLPYEQDFMEKFFSLEIPGIPGMRMVIFSLILVLIILFRRKGMMGTREFSWNGLFDFFTDGGKK